MELTRESLHILKQAGIMLVRACESALGSETSCIITKRDREAYERWRRQDSMSEMQSSNEQGHNQGDC